MHIYNQLVPRCIAKLGALITVVGCLSLLGCGDSDWAQVQGVVTVNGEPVGPGIISFQPKDSTSRGGGIAQFGPDGRFVMMSSGRKEGVAVGEYIVTVRDGQVDYQDESAAPPPPSTIPVKYAHTATSGLTKSVEPGAQTYDLDLKTD